MYVVLALDLGTRNVENQQYCEPYAAGVYHLNRLSECFNGDLKEKVLQMEREDVHLFDRENKTLVLHMIVYIVENYDSKPKIVIKK